MEGEEAIGRKWGQKDHQSTILSMVEIGWKILTGKDTPTMPLPSITD